MGFSLSVASIVSGLLFGTIGFVAFMYGKKQSKWRPLVLGIALMVYPYFITADVLLYGIGVVLTILLFFPKI